MLGIIGGTGLYEMEGLVEQREIDVVTPFGAPSAPVVTGKVDGVPVAFLPRHGTRHQILPGEINFRANLWALKSVGVRRLIGVSAVGSLSEPVRPGELAIPKQYIDWTRGKRAGSFFGDGLVGHVSTAEPTCPSLTSAIQAAGSRLGIRVQPGQTYACVEGPRLGTRAESQLLKQLGATLVGMTNVPEVFLAREAQFCYCAIAVVTDYDCWLDDPSQHVSVDKVMPVYRTNLERVKKILGDVIRSRATEPCRCRDSLAGAVMTSEKSLNATQQALLSFLRS